MDLREKQSKPSKVIPPRAIYTSVSQIAETLGGERLEGSGFEEETPDLGFHFDWKRLDQSWMEWKA